MSSLSLSEGKEEEEVVENQDEEDVNVSIRDITDVEKKLLDSTESSVLLCQGSNLHVWKLQEEVPNNCFLFSQVEVTNVALGGEHILILTTTGALFSEGLNEYGQLGVGDTEPRQGLNEVTTLSQLNVKGISCGARHNAVVCQDGSLYCWGDSRDGQCGVEACGIFTTPVKVTFPPLRRSDEKLSTPLLSTIVKQVSCAELFSVCIDTRGGVWSWGKGVGLGHGVNIELCLVPTLIKGLRQKKAIFIACGSFHCIAITQDDFQGSQFNLPSPDYRTASVSSAYYAELISDRQKSTTRVPFLQTSFYCSEDGSSDNGLRRSHSDTEINTHPNDFLKDDLDESVSISEVDLRHIDDFQHTNKNFIKRNLIFSPDAPSVASSQYYSADDVSPNHEQNDLPQSTGHNSDLIDTDSPTNTSPDNESVISSTPDSQMETSEANENENKQSLFDGKKSIFSNITKITSDSLQTLKSFATTESEGCDGTIGVSSYGTLDTVASTEVWSWGRNTYGQLGHDDQTERLIPKLVEALNSKCIQGITAGSYHSLAITVDGEVYSWGDNTFGQIGHTSTCIAQPQLVKVLEETRVWDIAAGRNFSLFLGDYERNKSEVYFCGEVEKQKVGRSISNPIVELLANDKKGLDRRWKTLSRRAKRNSEGSVSPNLIDVQLRKLVHFEKNEFVKSVGASDYSFACICDRFGSGNKIEPVYKFARGERLFHHQLTLIQKLVIEPFIKTDSWTNITKVVGGEALIPLVDSFVDLIHGITTELNHLTNVVKHTLPTQELFSYLFSDSFRAVYDRYSQCYCDALAVGAITSCNKLTSNIISKVKDAIKGLEKNLSITHASFESLLKAPLLRSHVYCDIAKRISAHCATKTESDHLKEVITRWLQFSDVNNKRMIMAGTTYKFWDETSTRISDALKDPQRRVLKSSKTDPLGLSRASRLSSHSYILCNDVFVHVQFNRNFQVFPLITLWADSVPDADYAQNAIQIQTPEESFTLSAGTPDGKIAWLTEINNAVASCLEACSSYSLDLSVNLSTGLLKAAVAREASYRYVNHPSYKSAHYKGMWMAGFPHGRGKMTWEDGSCYEGEFVKGQFHGCGQMLWPKNGSNTYEKCYNGEWRDGKMNGRGFMNYGQGEEYYGNFKDDTRHGHGTLKTSLNKTSLDTIYIGGWSNDMKSGYGVLDYIIRGEKYMGMWSNDLRNGHGVVVTVDGVYYEGKFFQNRLAGRGILLSEDETCYEGEFTADMLLSGKGVLTLPNGDFIDGTFYGNWGDNIKVNGVFSKFTNPLVPSHHDQSDTSYGSKLGTTDFTIDADTKWKSLFQECLISLGCVNGIEIEAEEAWKNVTNTVVKAAGSMTSMSSRNPTAKFDLDFVRQTDFQAQMNLATNLKGLQEYLSQVFDTIGHPLNTLVEGLIEVYRATYVGVGAHRRLLPHAVAEAKSYVSRLFEVLRILFPDLHDEEFVLLTNDTADGIMDPPVNSMSLLHPLLLPRLYPPLFTLYALLTEKTDALYTEKLYYLNKRGDIALLSFLGVKKKFWLLRHEKSIGNDNEVPIEPNHTTYASAVETLEQISTTYSPMGKIEILRQTFAKIHEEISTYFEGERQVLAMDDLFPLFQYIVIRARVTHLGSEIKFIEDLVDQSILVGEAGHMVTTLSVSVICDVPPEKGTSQDVNVKNQVLNFPKLTMSRRFEKFEKCDVPREKGTSQDVDVKNQACYYQIQNERDRD